MPGLQSQHGVSEHRTVGLVCGFSCTVTGRGWVGLGVVQDMKGQVYLLVSQSSAAGSPCAVTMGLLCRAALNGAERDSHQGLNTHTGLQFAHTPMHTLIRISLVLAVWVVWLGFRASVWAYRVINGHTPLSPKRCWTMLQSQNRNH